MSTIKEEIKKVEELLSNEEIGTDQYYNYLSVLENLHKLLDLEAGKKEKRITETMDTTVKILAPISAAVIAGMFGLVRTNRILKYEELDVITSKAFNLPKD